MASKPTPTRTIGALHFEDLEPHRFEDLIRQLIYDFRPWALLEGTGRLGGDEGFDVRGIENDALTADADEDDRMPMKAATERIWLIQCKREKAIGPKKLAVYLDAIASEKTGPLYGIISAAACDFSKAARDHFLERGRALRISEAYLWGKAEIEDMLVQPKNDHLLFAYFGISLQMRRRSLRTEVRTRLATKSKLTKCLDRRVRHVLVREANDERYPWQDTAKPWGERRNWSVFEVDGCRHDGLHLVQKRCMAFLDDDCASWDYAEAMNLAAVTHNNPWIDADGRERIEAFNTAHAAAEPVWSALPEKNRAWLEIFLVLPYDNILAIDEDGDDWFRGPHIYTTPFTAKHGPFAKHQHRKLETLDRRRAKADPKKRVAKFSKGDPGAAASSI